MSDCCEVSTTSAIVFLEHLISGRTIRTWESCAREYCQDPSNICKSCDNPRWMHNFEFCQISQRITQATTINDSLPFRVWLKNTICIQWSENIFLSPLEIVNNTLAHTWSGIIVGQYQHRHRSLAPGVDELWLSPIKHHLNKKWHKHNTLHYILIFRWEIKVHVHCWAHTINPSRKDNIVVYSQRLNG